MQEFINDNRTLFQFYLVQLKDEYLADKQDEA